jgi:hypothetical protein
VHADQRAKRDTDFGFIRAGCRRQNARESNRKQRYGALK